MSLSNLSRQYQTNSRSFSFGGKEWHEQIGSTGETWSIVANPYFYLTIILLPPYIDSAFCFHRRVHRIPNQVNEQLLQLHIVTTHRHIWSGNNVDRQPSFKTGHARDQSADFQRLQFWWG